MFHKLLFSVFIVLLASGVNGQVLIEGRVVDGETMVPVPYAHVIIKGTQQGAVANERGFFSIEAGQLPVVLVVSEIAHHSKLVRIVDTSFVNVQLEAFDFQLKDVEIRETGREYFKMANHVLDFEFYDDLILILGTSGKEIRLINHRGELVERTLTPGKFSEVFKDCLGNLHIVNEEQAYQVFYDYEELRFIHPHPREMFETYLRTCECRFQEGLIYSLGRRRGLVTTFFYAKGGHTMPFYEMGDSSAIEYLEQEYDIDYFVKERNSGNTRYAMSVAELKENIESLQSSLQVDWLDSRILHPSAYYVFSEEGELRVFGLGIMMEFRFPDLGSSPKKEICMIRDKDLDFMIKDEVSGKIYAVYRSTMGRVRVDHVDEPDNSIAIGDYAFPFEVKVHNDHIFFINDPAINGANYLFRKNKRFDEGPGTW